MIETLDDIVEQIANWAGVYGAHRDEDCVSPDHCCRCCWTAHLKSRILAAIEIDRKLTRRVKCLKSQ